MTHAPMTEDRPEIEDSAGQPPSYKWWVVGMLWFICFFNYADRQAIFSVFPLLEQELGFNKEQLGWIGAAFTWVYALTAPIAGQVGDRYPRKLIIIGGLYVWSIVTGFTALCTKTWHFVLVRGAEGLGETFYFPASMSLISDYHSKQTRSRAMSLHQTSVYAGTIGGGALAGWIGQQYGWKWTFVLLGSAGVALGLVLARFIREPKRNEADLREMGKVDHVEVRAVPLGEFFQTLLQTPTAMLLILAFFGANFVALVFLTWLPTFLREKFDLGLANAGFTATFYPQMSSMVGAMLGGVLADLFRKRLSGGRIFIQSMGLLLGAPFILLSGQSDSLVMTIVGMSLFGLFKGIYDSNIWASLYDVVEPSRRGTAVGIMNMIGWLGGGLGAISIGMVVKRNLMTMSEAVASTGLIYLVVSALLIFASFFLAPRDVQRAQVTGA